MSPVQQDVQNHRPHLSPGGQGPRGAVAEAAQPPGLVFEGCDHAGVCLPHLRSREQGWICEEQISQKVMFWMTFRYLVDDFGLKRGDHAGVVQRGELAVCLMKH